MQRVKYNRENQPDPAVVKRIEEREIDFEVGQDEEEEERFDIRQPEDLKPGVSVELVGITEDIPRIEEWQAANLAHGESVIGSRLPPEILKAFKRP
jgi:hypothetical protein